MISTDKVSLGLLHQFPDFGRFQVLQLVAIRCSEISAHGAIVSSDDDTTASGWLFIVHSVLRSQPQLVCAFGEGFGILVAANASDEDNRIWRQNVLRRTTESANDSRDYMNGNVSSIIYTNQGMTQECPVLIEQSWSYLYTSCGILCSSTRNQLSLAVLYQVVIETKVLFFSQNGIIGLETILLKHLLIT
jgi:hypothetical protein